MPSTGPVPAAAHGPGEPGARDDGAPGGCASGGCASDGTGRRRRLTPAVADIRRAVRGGLRAFLFPGAPLAGAAGPRRRDRPDGVIPPEPGVRAGGRAREQPDAPGRPVVLVALSGGPDSLALAAATAFEAPRMRVQAGAVIVDHGLQEGSAGIARTAAAQARRLGLAPVIVTRVRVPDHSEAAARTARYAALDAAAEETGARAILLAHTRDDQAETVLLGLARGSGARSLAGMPEASGRYLRPLLGIPRALTHRFCRDAGLEAWHDPMNDEARYARVRVRRTVLPVLEAELGPGIAAALARTATQLREDADALDALAGDLIGRVGEPVPEGLAIPVAALAAEAPALRHRAIRLAVHARFGTWLHRVHVLAVAALVTDWHGQKALDLPGVRVVRQGTRLVFSAPRPREG